ncbi:hypothetical protein P3L10_032936 [Capsicum annuum]
MIMEWSNLTIAPQHMLISKITDGSAIANPGPGGLRGTFRNRNGEWVLGYYQHIPSTTPTMAELLAIRAGLLIAKENNLQAFEIETDSTTLITILNNDHPLYANIVAERRSLMEELGAVALTKIYREKNSVADCLVKEGTKKEYLPRPTVLTSVPIFAAKCVNDNYIGKTFNRFVKHSNTISQGRDVALNSYFLPPTFDSSSNPLTPSDDE